MLTLELLQRLTVRKDGAKEGQRLSLKRCPYRALLTLGNRKLTSEELGAAIFNLLEPGDDPGKSCSY